MKASTDKLSRSEKVMRGECRTDLVALICLVTRPDGKRRTQGFFYAVCFLLYIGTSVLGFVSVLII